MEKETNPPYSNTGVTKNRAHPSRPHEQLDRPFKENKFWCSYSGEYISQNILLGQQNYDWFAGTVKGKLKGFKPDRHGNAVPVHEYLDIKDMLNHALTVLTGLGISPDDLELWDTRLSGRYYNKSALFISRGWAHAIHFIDPMHQSILSLSYGGQNADKGIFLAITGRDASIVYPAFKNHLKDNLFKATRVDACTDIKTDWPDLKKLIKNSCKRRQLPFNTQGGGFDKHGNRLGETIYIQLTDNKTIRIYEKGLQQIAAGVDAPSDWVRFEIQIKGEAGNDSTTNNILSDLTPKEILTMDKDTSSLYSTFMNKAFEASDITLTVKIVTNDQKKIEALKRQYGNTLRELILTDPVTANLFFRSLFDEADSPIPSWIEKESLLLGLHGNGENGGSLNPCAERADASRVESATSRPFKTQFPNILS